MFFAANGFGPYKCFDCGEDVLFEFVLIHHVDHNHLNNHPSNLTPAHQECHISYHRRHRTGTTLSEEHKRKISAANKGRVKPPEECARLSLAAREREERKRRARTTGT